MDRIETRNMALNYINLAIALLNIACVVGPKITHVGPMDCVSMHGHRWYGEKAVLIPPGTARLV